MHGSRNVREDIHFSVDAGHVLRRDFHRILQRIANIGWHRLIDIIPCRQQLVWEDFRFSNQLCISQTIRDHLHHFLVVEDTMSSKRVQVHPQTLGAHASGQRLPDQRALRGVGQQVPTGRRNGGQSSLFLRGFRLTIGRKGLDFRR